VKKLSLSVLVAAAAALPLSAQAVSLEFRHDYKHHSDQHGNRVRLSASTGMFHYGLRVKFAAVPNEDGSQDAFRRMNRGDSQLDWGIRYNLTENWYINTGMPIVFGDKNYSLLPQLQIGYRANSLPLTSTLRYRRQITSYANDSSKDYSLNRITLSLSYKPSQNQYWLDVNYYKNEDKDIFNNTAEDYDYRLGMGRRMGSWFPFLEFSDVKVGADTATRQLRSRVGIKYYF